MEERSHLAIGEVLSLLRDEFPDVTISKIRFLESQGLVNPERTPSGYRKFYDADVERLRWILLQQKEHFLPLKVIKDRLAELDPAGESDPEQTSDDLLAVGAAELPRAAEVRPDDLALLALPLDAPDSPLAEVIVTEVLVMEGGGEEEEVADPGLFDDVLSGSGGLESGEPGGAEAGRAESGGAESGGAESGGAEPGLTFAGPEAAMPETVAPEAVAPETVVPEAELSEEDVVEIVALELDTEPAEAGEPLETGETSDAAEPAALGEPGARSEPATEGARVGLAPPADDPSPVTRTDAAAPRRTGGGGGTTTGQSETLTLEELAAAAGVDLAAIAELQSFGLVTPSGAVGGTTYFDHVALEVARTVGAFARHGVEARHLRAWRNGAEREASLFEQVVMPLLRQRNPQARHQAEATLAELAGLGADLREALVRQALRSIR